MKILQISNKHFPKGGADKVYLNTAQLLKDAGHEVFYFSQIETGIIQDENSGFFPESVDIRQKNFTLKLLSLNRFIYNKDAGKMAREYLKEIKPDIAHVHLFMGGLTISVLEAIKEEKIPVVHSVHDYRLICPAYLFLDGNNRICEKCKRFRYYNCVLNRCSDNNIGQSFALAIDAFFRYFNNPDKLIDRYIFVSKFVKNKHLEFGFGQTEKYNLLYNFMPNLDSISPSRLRGDYFIYLGRLSREKGLMTLIRVFRSVTMKLKLVGDGPLREEIESNISDNIQIMGYRSGKELEDLIRKSAWVIVPSECYENNPLSIIESYSHGKPVIGSRLGGIPEIVIDGVTGFLFEHSDIHSLKEKITLASSLSDNEYQRISDSAREFAKTNFNPRDHLTSLTDIYKKLLG